MENPGIERVLLLVDSVDPVKSLFFVSWCPHPCVWGNDNAMTTLIIAHKYVVSTVTGDVRGAGTDADVFITLFSKAGNSAEMKLNDSKNNFERKKYVPCIILFFIIDKSNLQHYSSLLELIRTRYSSVRIVQKY